MPILRTHTHTHHKCSPLLHLYICPTSLLLSKRCVKEPAQRPVHDCSWGVAFPTPLLWSKRHDRTSAEPCTSMTSMGGIGLRCKV
jgi:hypothetical protein